MKRLWRWLTSIRLAIILIAILAGLTLVGTIIPQQATTRTIDYISRFGYPGYRIIHALQVDDLFHSWYWYGLLLLFAANLGACTYRRLLASFRLLRVPMRPQGPERLGRMKTTLSLGFPAGEQGEGAEGRAKKALRRRRYRLNGTGAQIYGEKGRFGRLGADVLHLGLLTVLSGALIGGLLGFRDFQTAHAGEVFSVPRGGFSVRVDDLWDESYQESEQFYYLYKDYYTKLTILEDGKEILTKTIEVNHPLTYKGVSFYQAAYGEDWQGAARLKIEVTRTEDGQSLGRFPAQVGSGFSVPEEGIRVEVAGFLPDFALTGEMQAYSKSARLENPAAYLEAYGEGGELLFRTWTFALYPELRTRDLPYRFAIVGMTAPKYTGLIIKKDPGLPLVYLGFALMASGLIACFYLPHRRVWIHLGDEQILIAGQSRLRWFRRELEGIAGEIKDGP